MQCPNCHMEMQVSHREAIRLLYCPQCGGVWVQCSTAESVGAQSAEVDRGARPDARNNARDDQDEDRDDERSTVWGGRRGRDNDDDSGGRGGPGGFLGNLFNLH
jgi:Zn-finger nucleic acid-binding protein